MSIFSEISKHAYEAVAYIHNDCLTLGDDIGTKIAGTLNIGTEIVTAFDLGIDPRELSLFIVVNPVPQGTFGGVLRDIDANDFLLLGEDKWMVTTVEDDRADFTTKYWLRKVVPQKDR